MRSSAQTRSSPSTQQESSWPAPTDSAVARKTPVFHPSGERRVISAPMKTALTSTGGSDDATGRPKTRAFRSAQRQRGGA